MFKNILKHDSHMGFILFLFFAFTVSWILLGIEQYSNVDHNHLFAALYGIMALLGGSWGIWIANKWGGMKSVLGKALMFMSLGLLAAEFGQIVFSYYNIVLHEPVPYPSLADLGFFANIPLYSMGMIYLARVAGVQFNLDKIVHKLQIVLIPVLMLGVSYFFSLRGYEFDPSDPLRTFLDFAYPLGQSFYVSLALLTYSLSKKTLGGVMRSRVLLLIIAFFVQYVADYNFLYQAMNGTWVNGGYGDYLYLLAYTSMTIAILEIKYAYNLIREKS